MMHTGQRPNTAKTLTMEPYLKTECIIQLGQSYSYILVSTTAPPRGHHDESFHLFSKSIVTLYASNKHSIASSLTKPAPTNLSFFSPKLIG